MSTERTEGYIEALGSVRSMVRHRVNQADVPEDGKLELLDLLSILDNVLKGNEPQEEPHNDAPDPFSGSF